VSEYLLVVLEEGAEDLKQTSGDVEVVQVEHGNAHAAHTTKEEEDKKLLLGALMTVGAGVRRAVVYLPQREMTRGSGLICSSLQRARYCR
jgi:hypothetical protein